MYSIGQKYKLTVSNQFSILKTFKNQGFKDQESRFENLGLRSSKNFLKISSCSLEESTILFIFYPHCLLNHLFVIAKNTKGKIHFLD